MTFVPLRRPVLRWLAGVALVAEVCAGSSAHAQQVTPKTSDISFAVSADGSLNMAFQMAFDAPNWRAWKAMVGEEPSRMRAMMRHQFAAMTLEDFKLERDDMNRTAKMSMHSPSGPELREDGAFQIPVDGYFRLVNHAGQEWFFSGNNPNAGGTLNNVKVTLPANVTNAYVASPDNPDQALVFALAAPPSPGRWFYLAGAVVSLLGLALLLVGLLTRRAPLRLPAGQTQALPMAGATGTAYPPAFSPPPMVPPPFNPPPAVPPAFTPRPATRMAPPSTVEEVLPVYPVANDGDEPSTETPPQPGEATSPLSAPRATPPPFNRVIVPPAQPPGGYAEPD